MFKIFARYNTGAQHLLLIFFVAYLLTLQHQRITSFFVLYALYHFLP